MSKVILLRKDDDFPTEIEKAGDRLVVVDFGASWCGPCQNIAPIYDQLSQKYPTVVFLKVDVEVCTGLRQAMHIEALPTFIFWRNGAVQYQFSGADRVQLESCIDQLMRGVIPGSGADKLQSDCGVPGQSSLIAHIDKKSIECLNQSSSHTVNALFQDGSTSGFLESDCDEQLIISVSFQQAVKIHSLRFFAPSDGHGPKIIKIFINRTSTLDFDEAEIMEAVQEILVAPTDIVATKEVAIPLRFVKFQNVTNLTLFIKTNQGGLDTTQIQRLDIIGTLREATNMADFKRVSGKEGERD